MAAYNDKDYGFFTAAPTMKHISLRFLKAVTVSQRFSICVRVVTKAFIMSRSPLRRPVLMKAPKETNVGKEKAVEVVKQAHDMPEFSIHCFKTNGLRLTDYHKEMLGMKQSSMNSSVIFVSTDVELDSIVGIQVDEKIFAGCFEFVKKEE